MKSILDKCRQIKDPESGRVLLYRDEIEAVLEAERLLRGDTIYRQAVIDVLSQYPFEKVINCLSIIEEFPSAQPEIVRCIKCSNYKQYIFRARYWDFAGDILERCQNLMIFVRGQKGGKNEKNALRRVQACTYAYLC